MADEILRELWRVKDGIAEEYGWDVRAFVAHLRTQRHIGSQHVVDLRTMKPIADKAPKQTSRSRVLFSHLVLLIPLKGALNPANIAGGCLAFRWQPRQTA